MQILFEDNHLVVVNKPAGLLSQGEETGDENLVDLLRAHFGRNYVGLVHRLDRNTSGLMIVAKRSKAANRLTSALQEGLVIRRYLGWIEGRLNSPVRWEHKLLKDERTNQVRVFHKNHSLGKIAVMNALPEKFSTLRNLPITLARFQLETGRSHQIRAQCAFEGHPIVGDRKYKSTADFPRTALHSCELEFPHPMSGELMKYEVEMPGDMQGLLH
ncbi:RluA family pseudouridine synthase [Bdellovibrionota bacterium FG-2]